MKQENLRRGLFVTATCLLSFPWLTPCVGIWSAAAVNGTHDSITRRDEPLNRLPDPRLKTWAAKPGPKLTVISHQPISPLTLIMDAEVSAANGGRNASRPGTLVGKGASALVDGVTYALVWVDPFTWVSQNSMGMEPTQPKRRLILCESPFVMLEGNDIRYTRTGKAGVVRLVLAKNAKVTVITPDGSFSASAEHIHYRGPSQEVLLEKAHAIRSHQQYIRLAKDESLVKLNFVKRSISCTGELTQRDSYLTSMLRQKQPTSPAVP